MDYALRIVVEKVAVSSQEVVQRDLITSSALRCPTAIGELGLRHTAQIALLEQVQNIILVEQSVLFNLGTHICPACGNPLKKNHIPPDLVVECITAYRKPPEVRICRLRNQSTVGTRPPSTSTPHCPACMARR